MCLPFPTVRAGFHMLTLPPNTSVNECLQTCYGQVICWKILPCCLYCNICLTGEIMEKYCFESSVSYDCGKGERLQAGRKENDKFEV